MITSDKVLAYPERLLSGRKPVTADVFLTRRCNSACTYCTYSRYMRRNGPDMPPEVFDAVLDRLLGFGVQGVILTGGGEPTIASSFDHATEVLEARGIPYGVNTNFVERKEIRPVYLKVSLDCHDAESYRRTRGVDKFDAVIANIAAFYEWKMAESPRTSVVVQCIATSYEVAEGFLSITGEISADCIVVRPVESTGGTYYRGNDSEVWRIRELVESCSDKRVLLNPKFGQLGYFPTECKANGLQIAVDEMANVVYCCHKPYEVVGSIFDEDILEKMDNWRTDMSMCDVPCRLTSANMVYDSIELARTRSDAAFI